MKRYEVLALTNGYFQVMCNTDDNKYWVLGSRELPTLEHAQKLADTMNDYDGHMQGSKS